MAPILWALGGALTVYLVGRRQSQTRPTIDLTKVHGELMANCHNPQKLAKAAALFGSEGLPQHAQALLRKARTVHEMMHGAKDIVERCRAGDQHAMAMAKGIGEQARAGNQRAQISAFLIEEYTKAHPATQQAA